MICSLIGHPELHELFKQTNKQKKQHSKEESENKEKTEGWEIYIDDVWEYVNFTSLKKNL